jgi:peptidoglycan/xylan/chitin deacetylase (PgdA/CDA1 family)
VQPGKITPLNESSIGKSAWGGALLFRRARALGKTLLYGLYLYSGYVQIRDFVLGRLGRARVVVLYYHRIGGRDVMSKPADEFRRDLEYLSRKYECITLLELYRRLGQGKPLRRRTAVVTFDDGYRDNYTVALPVLKEVGVRATFFVSTGFIGTNRGFLHDAGVSNGPDERPEDEQVCYPKLTWDDLRDMEEDDFEIGSHTVNHVNLGSADEQAIACEVTNSLSALNHQLGARPRAFSFPWGKPENIPPSAFESVAAAGYYTTVSAYGGYNTRGSNPFHIRRIDAGNGHMCWLTLRARIAGFDPDYLMLKLSGEAAMMDRAVSVSKQVAGFREKRVSSL